MAHYYFVKCGFILIITMVAWGRIPKTTLHVINDTHLARKITDTCRV